jgi:phosphatidylglycerophosphate synthase
MTSSPVRQAILRFETLAAAHRPVAGVPAAARIAREIRLAGFERAWLVVPAGSGSNPGLEAELARVAEGLEVIVCHAAPEAAVGAVEIPGDRWLPSECLARGETGSTAGFALASTGVDLALLRTTGKRSDGPVSHWLNRPVSRRLSALLLKIPAIRPGHATAANIAVAAAMTGFLLFGGATGVVVAGLLFQAASVLDGVDGEIARATFRTSQSGAVLDSAVDAATTLLLLIGLAFNLHWRGYDLALPLAGWGIGLYAFGLFVLAWRGSRVRGSFTLDHVKRDFGGRTGRLVPALMRFLTIVSSRDFFALLFAALMVTGAESGVLIIFAAAAVVWVPFVLGGTMLSRVLPAPKVAETAAIVDPA